MRILILAALVGVIGCDNNSINNENDASIDMSMSGDGGGDIGAGASCDLLKQDCGSGMKCTLVGGGMGTAPTPTCVTDGTVAEGQPCMRGMMGQPDNCEAGLTCSRTGSVCRKICGSDTDCGSNEACAILSFAVTDVGQCIPTCAPFSDTCGNSQTCASITLEVGATQQNQQVLFTCRATGTAGAYEDCMRANDCGANLYCSQDGVCVPLCDASHDCVAYGDGSVPICASAGTTLPGDPGICN
jgi:hypothetical protein